MQRPKLVRQEVGRWVRVAIYVGPGPVLDARAFFQYLPVGLGCGSADVNGGWEDWDCGDKDFGDRGCCARGGTVRAGGSSV